MKELLKKVKAKFEEAKEEFYADTSDLAVNIGQKEAYSHVLEMMKNTDELEVLLKKVKDKYYETGDDMCTKSGMENIISDVLAGKLNAYYFVWYNIHDILDEGSTKRIVTDFLRLKRIMDER